MNILSCATAITLPMVVTPGQVRQHCSYHGFRRTNICSLPWLGCLRNKAGNVCRCCYPPSGGSLTLVNYPSQSSAYYERQSNID